MESRLHPRRDAPGQAALSRHLHHQPGWRADSDQYGEIILFFSKIEKIVTTIALPDRSEVEELSSDYAQSILDKVSGHWSMSCCSITIPVVVVIVNC